MKNSASYRSALLAFIVLAAVAGCSDNTQPSAAARSAALQSDLLLQFRTISSAQEAQRSRQQLETLFFDIARLMVEADQAGFEIEESEAELARISREVEVELRRLVAIPGVEKVLKQAQERGLQHIEKARQSKSRMP